MIPPAKSHRDVELELTGERLKRLADTCRQEVPFLQRDATSREARELADRLERADRLSQHGRLQKALKAYLEILCQTPDLKRTDPPPPPGPAYSGVDTSSLDQHPPEAS